jgi:hypothetical protein
MYRLMKVRSGAAGRTKVGVESLLLGSGCGELTEQAHRSVIVVLAGAVGARPSEARAR